MIGWFMRGWRGWIERVGYEKVWCERVGYERVCYERVG